MSWLSISDFAKTALSDVQKKIDKVLDIQEDEEVISEKTEVIAEPAKLATFIKEANNVRKHKKLSNKKPSKLGSSLTKKTPQKNISNLNHSIIQNDINQEKVTENIQTNKSQNSSFDPTVSSETNEAAILDISQSSLCSEDTKSLMEENKEADDDDIETEHEKAREVVMISDREITGTTEIKKLKLEAEGSPRTSTSASSDVDVLDHESVYSEISFVSKTREMETLQFSSLESPLNRTAAVVDSNDSEASDIIAFSGYCSPVSVDGFEDSVHISPGNFTKSTTDEIKSSEQNSDSSTESSVRDKLEDSNQQKRQVNDEEKIDDESAVYSSYETMHSDGDTVEKFKHYEVQLVSLSLSNAKLNEDNDNLRNEIEHLKLEIKSNIVEENNRLEDQVESLKLKIQDFEVLKKSDENRIHELKMEISKRLTNEEVQVIVQEKDESIQGLLQEGEQLSKKEHQQSQLIKKLRSKFNESEEVCKELSEKLDKFQTQNETLKERLGALESCGREDRSQAEELMQAYRDKENEINNLKTKLEKSEEKSRSSHSALDSAFKDIGDLNKKCAFLESELQKVVEKCEEKTVEKLLKEKSEIECEHQNQLKILRSQINEMRLENERIEEESSDRKQLLQKEINDLQKRLQDSENRNYELTESISDSTRPLVRQIEGLQASHSNQSKSWELLENSLNARLEETQLKLVTIQERENNAQKLASDAKKSLRRLEEQVKNLKKDKILLEDDVTRLKVTSESNEEELLRQKLMTSEKEWQDGRGKLKREKLQLEHQLDAEKTKLENEKKKFQQQTDLMQKEKERLLWINRQDSLPSGSMFNGDAESFTSSIDHTDVIENQRGFIFDGLIRKGTSHGANLMENLQSQLKMKEGENIQLQGEINTLERTRSSMAEEIVRLTNENEEFEMIKDDFKLLKQQLQEMKNRHDAVLMMYGEKAEENEELKMDLADVKEMYRQQIDTLLKNPSS